MKLDKLFAVCTSAVLFILASLIPAFSEVAITEDNFPDTNFREYILSSADTDRDGYLSDEEIASVTIMEIFERDIDSLAGIKYFSALQELYCYTNNLQELDVSGNSELLLLECDNNKLSRLDLKHNTKLLNLECEANNLAELDLSNNINLSYVKCYTQTIYGLTVSKDESDYKVALSTHVSDMERVIDVSAYDESGDVISGISFDHLSGILALASYPKSIKYGYDIGYVNDATLSMDVTAMAGSLVVDEDDDSSSRCGGCNSVFSIFTLSILAVFLIKKRSSRIIVRV